MLLPLLHVDIANSPGLAASPHVTITLLLTIAGSIYLVLRRPQGALTAGVVPASYRAGAACVESADRGRAMRVSSFTCSSWRMLGRNATGAGLVLALALVLSLLSFPTSCRCGASLPHEHVLFDLPGHYHRGHPAAGTVGTTDANDYNGPLLRAAEGSGAIGQPATAVVQLLSYPLLRVLQVPLFSSVIAPDGLVLVPDSPPPRV
ncbi:hypothetical protein NET02_01380 [Thermomicrobiaceae bacterium CFH 74404]|uniref:Uncharacterized protein n=1 Tax=Thermalbibacter longus TaxID=2951981 RepID=A0AA41WD01_9BACT|nr:hypothetical protein [Thermalbibacter longus]MCM8747793.1 hypothetical protein [Thermalbibacter longus]